MCSLYEYICFQGMKTTARPPFFSYSCHHSLAMAHFSQYLRARAPLCSSLSIKARALAPTDTTEATGMYRSLDKLKAKAAQSFRYPSSSGAIHVLMCVVVACMQ